MILAVDLGNYNIKTSEEVIFSSRFVQDSDFAPVGEDIIEYNNKIYTMQKGEFENKFNKAEKNYMPNLLYAIAQSTSDKEIDLVLGVPLDNLSIRDKFKNELKGKTFKFIFNNNDREITINRIATIAEGMSSFYTLSKTDREKDTLIIDIGGRTTNVVSFINTKAEKKFTINKGMIDLYDAIKTRVNLEGNNYNLEEIERLIKNGVFSNVENEYSMFVNSIMNSIELKLKYDTYYIWFTGGGSIILEDVIKATVKKAKFIENALFSNAIGNKKVAKMKWSK
ncbi:ParM/StbA family protein [Clostridium botulinum]|uniref:ParM/StbA family protein n=1 Tax=Clostridium botulinum TaxID=1491 RepID=UPI00196715AD|nr:ParM/StbA family protein [Clostridium botulinum]MBN1079250.1 ATPase [Clostridium botulinum]